jgi:hypothetical protein
MLDVRIRRYVSPLAEQVLDDITPSIEVRNYADEDATITGIVRIYRKSTDSLEYTSELAETELTHGTTATISALSAWSPGAPADDDYFILADIVATSYLPGPPLAAVLGAFTFDVKPGPMGPAPAGHHATHESGGMDEVDCTGLVGAGGAPIAHAASHENGGGDEVNVAGLSGELADDQPPKAHGNAAHSVTFEDQANKGVAGGYAGLPNPLNSSLMIRADGTAGRSTGFHEFCDFTRSGIAVTWLTYPWQINAIAGGTASSVPGSANHPGIIYLRSAIAVNSGISIPLQSDAFLIAGDCHADFIIRPQTLAGSVIRCGYMDIFTINDNVDGAYFEMNTVVAIPGTIVGKCASNSARTTTATSFVLVTNTWYRLTVEVNAAANLVTFTIKDEAGAVLWTDTVNANIPTGAGRQTGHGINAFNTGAGPVTISDIDYMDIEINRALVR